jgi:hypothetical protein
VSADVDLDGLHGLAVEVDATRRLVTAADGLLDELRRRVVDFRTRIDALNGAEPDAEPGPTRMDRIRDLSGASRLEADMRRLSFHLDRFLAEDLDEDPPWCNRFLNGLIEADVIDDVVAAHRRLHPGPGR